MNVIHLFFSLLCFLTLFSPLALAHHPVASANSGSRTLYYQGNQAQPSSRAYFSFDFQHEDNAIGQLLTFNLGGEWALSKKISLLGLIPLNYLAHNARNNEWGLGDISFGGKVSFLADKTILFSSLQIFLPTGDQGKGFGRKGIGNQFDLFGGITLHDWVLYLNPGINFGWSSPRDPVFSAVLGLESPHILDEKINFGLSLSSNTYLDSATFTAGSSKVSLNPQINWSFDKKRKWTLTQSLHVSIIDQLSLKPAVTLNNTSLSLLNDTLWGLTTTLNYNFN
ncbi:MAG: hypothetical protein ACD_73C00140G0003 [uncultured bacterium]|nr:MAG: hypothetical protein ACD_73C00140G0003 [uncultured bacterium]